MPDCNSAIQGKLKAILVWEIIVVSRALNRV